MFWYMMCYYAQVYIFEGNNMQYTHITSRKNPQIQDVIKLYDKKQRDSSLLFLASGIKLLKEAVISGLEIESIFFTENALEKYKDDIKLCKNAKLYFVSDDVFEKISTEKAPQGILSVVKRKPYIFDLENVKDKSFVILEDLQNPLNLGAIIRCAFSLGFENIALCGDCADAYGDKAVRSAMGSLYKVNLYRFNKSSDIINAIRKTGSRVFCTCLDESSKKLGSFDFSCTDSIVIGNEGHGASNETISLCDEKLYIPMTDGAESLNAATACAVVMWEMKKETLR